MRFGATILDADGLRLTADEKALFREAAPFGFILFARNVDTPDQIRALCDELREAAGHNCLITIDQEGGRVQRLRAPLARNWRPALEHVQLATDAPRAMYLRARLIAHELRALGIDSNCAPLLDIAAPETHPFLRNRCYGEDLQQVVALARATAQGHLDGGVVPVMKHMPGHGRATQDSHKDLPRVTASAQALQAQDFAAFAALADLPMAMTAHLVYEAFDPRPATISPVMLDLMRRQIGYDGLIMTDDISMKALTGTPAALAQQSLQAGCDVALFCNATLAERAEVAAAAGRMSNDAQRRAEAALALRYTAGGAECPAEAGARDIAPLDIAAVEAAEAELSALMGGQVYG